ncbi:MAG TPA: choice-of-anchor D domain-containing protein, partial [Solirubrobacteraceae bacterium]
MFKRSVPLAALVSFAMLLVVATASAQPSIEAAPAQLEYGTVDLHFGGTPQQIVKFTNNTPGTLHVTAAELSGADPSSFQIVNDGCSGNFVGAGENCSLEVVFKPSARGPHVATLVLLTLDESAGEVSAEVPISASAATGTPSPSPSQLSFSPIPYNPPQSFEGENNESESLSIQNSSDFGTQLGSVSITGPDAADFSVEWGNCENDQMWPSNSCGMGIRFRPSATGVRTASLVVQSDSAAGQIVVPLSGVGLHGPQMTLDTTQALLGNVALGDSAQHTFTVTNTGDYLLYIQRSFLVTGTPLMFPVRADSCTARILSPSEACAVTVGFQPSTLGEKSAAMLFITNTPAINVAGIDGIGIRGADEADPSLSMPLLSTPAPSAPVPSPAPPPAPAPGANQAPTPPQALSAARAPRLYSLLGHTTLDPGADIQCPAAARDCEA